MPIKPPKQLPTVEELSAKYKPVLPYLNDRTRALYAACEYLSFGRGAANIVAKSMGISKHIVLYTASNVTKDRKYMSASHEARLNHSELIKEISAVIEELGDGLSYRQIASALQNKGLGISHVTVRNLRKKYNL